MGFNCSADVSFVNTTEAQIFEKNSEKIQDNVTRKAVLIKVQTQLTKRQQIMNKTLNADAMAMALGKKS
jgi:hypothetical protein